MKAWKKLILGVGMLSLTGLVSPTLADGFSVGFSYNRGPRYYRSYYSPVRAYAYYDAPVVAYDPAPDVVVYDPPPVVVRDYPSVYSAYSYYPTVVRSYPAYRGYYGGPAYRYYGGGAYYHGGGVRMHGGGHGGDRHHRR